MSRPVAFHLGIHYSQKNHSSLRSYILYGVTRAKLLAGQGLTDYQYKLGFNLRTKHLCILTHLKIKDEVGTVKLY